MKTILILFVLITTHTVLNAQTKKVIFVCEHGAAKSFIAASFFNKLAKEAHLNWEAVSRATVPDSTLNEGTRKGLQADFIYEANRIPRKISYQDTVGVEKIILFTNLPSDWQSEITTQDWSKLPNIDSSYSQRRDSIVRKLKELISTLE